MADPSSLWRDLIARWRAEAARISSFHATMGSGWSRCADELEVLVDVIFVGRETPAPQPLERYHAILLLDGIVGDTNAPVYLALAVDQYIAALRAEIDRLTRELKAERPA